MREPHHLLSYERTDNDADHDIALLQQAQDAVETLRQTLAKLGPNTWSASDALSDADAVLVDLKGDLLGAETKVAERETEGA